MRTVLLLLLTLHALIHLLGFAKAFGLMALPNFQLPVSRPMGLAWLGAALQLLTWLVAMGTGNRWAWVLGVFALGLSQALILIHWDAARWGSLANLLVLILVLAGYGEWLFRQSAEREASRLSAAQEVATVPLQNPDFLPDPVRRWLARSGALDRDPVRGGRVSQRARLQMKPEQSGWAMARATQVSTLSPPAMIWQVRLEMLPFLSILGRDKYEAGQGGMRITLLGLLPFAEEQGPRVDESTLQRFLGEMVWFPSFTLSPYVTWERLDERSARATMNFGEASGSGTFHFDEAGDFIRFEALRYYGNAEDAERHPWILQVQDYATFQGIRVPSKMTATWRLPEGDWTWLELEITDLDYSKFTL